MSFLDSGEYQKIVSGVIGGGKDPLQFAERMNIIMLW